ncbi:hypothetical protein JHK82_014622 [Glycine max]|uniref:CUE domain-containing protein n=2 Tax=Glycine subgen. Soja TaxID=1462606 RepID=I1K907_SOYBN|nr:polyadenylate-binding protein-interacting protein 5 [Glycine max]XP_028235332.1 polyadenylate-binding protein-interacting protein 5-like [Glycine soja]KAG5018681.1 hypothetical protein JHK87_014536 [Glycine soja]KAG5045236.1 hypothetical protein JHK86_014642 [Glycine max]KAG5147741.1 hypothetical protein JHK82_014622 [Glycine max]KAH1124618.1 hypothetical protein GYH30_014353 [Glycine max]KAH1244857.1 Polyadenylate-binding protein-interacting protein 5 [Glycine max]|eukprot:XP_003526437.1 polyadenylate-binding protein-interacting protein 5 [Glycine max]
MKSTMAGRVRSCLNPHAASFVPLFKRDDDEAPPQPHQHQHILESSLQLKKTNPSPPPQLDVTELIEEDADLDIELLKIMFPDFAEQSLRDVYFVNYADLNAAIDMLDHLKFDCDESSKTLDIGSVSESAPSAGSGSPKLNNTAAKASAS